MLKKLLAKLELSTLGVVKAPPASLSTGRAVFKEAVFCGISPLGTHLDDETFNKIWNNQYVDIRSLVTVDQHMTNKERRVFSKRPSGNDVELVTGICVTGPRDGQKHPAQTHLCT